MSISGGPRRLAGLQRTPAAYANEAALAISSRAGEEGPRRLRTWVSAAPRSSHLGLRRPRLGAALLGCPGAASAGRGAVRTVATNPPRRTGCKLWWRPRGAVSAGAPGSPLYRVPAPSPAPPPRRLRAAPPGASGRGQGSGPAPLSRPGRSGAAPPALRVGWPTAFGPRQRVAAPLSSPGPFRLRCPCLRTFSPSSCPLRGVLRQPARLRGSRPERSAHARVAGLRQDQLSGSEAARAARLLPSLRSPPLCCPPPLRSPPTSECPPRPPPPLGPPRLRARLPGPPHGGRLLKSREGRGQRDFGAAPLFPFPLVLWPQCPLSGPAEWATSATQSSKSTKVRRAGR